MHKCECISVPGVCLSYFRWDLKLTLQRIVAEKETESEVVATQGEQIWAHSANNASSNSTSELPQPKICPIKQVLHRPTCCLHTATSFARSVLHLFYSTSSVDVSLNLVVCEGHVYDDQDSRDKTLLQAKVEEDHGNNRI